MCPIESKYAVLDQLAYLEEFYDNCTDSISKEIEGEEEILNNLLGLEEVAFKSKCQARRSSSKKRKRASTEISLPENPAQFYIGKLIAAMNYYDSSQLYTFLSSIAAPNLQIVKRSYNLPSTASSPGAIEKPLVDAVFNNIESFCQFMSAWHVLVPDGVFSASAVRTVVDSLPTFLFMSTFSFSGVNVAPEIDLVNSPFEQYHCQQYEQVAMKSIIGRYYYSNGFTSQRIKGSFHAQGSLALFVNREGELEKLEIYISGD